MLLQMSFGALLPVCASAAFYLAEKKTAFGGLRYWERQLIIGLIFGAIAILGTEHGVPITGAVINVRDAAPICAGLIFGAPAGVIAGVLGGVERWFAVLWGVGAYTRVACSVSTALAGILAALFRKYMFDDKKPSWYYGLAIGLVVEVVHMVMVFSTNMNDVPRAFAVVKACAGPMVFFNGVSVMTAVLAVNLIGKERVRPSAGAQQNLSQSFQRWLLVSVVIAFLATSVFTFILQNGLTYNSAETLLDLNIADVRSHIADASDANLLALTRSAARRLGESTSMRRYVELVRLARDLGLSEINLVNEDGIITESTNLEFVGFDMNSGEQARAFLVLLDGVEEYVQSYQAISYDKQLSRKYAGAALRSGGFVQVGYDAAGFQQDIAAQVKGATHNRHVGESGFIIICDENWRIVSDRNNFEGENLAKTGLWIDRERMPEGISFEAEVYGERSLCRYGLSEGYTIIAVLPYSEAVFSRDVAVYVTVFMEIIVFAVMFALIYFLVKKLVVENIRRINGTLAEITGGNLDVTVDVRTNEEFSSLSDDINSTVATLKRYIAEAAARIDRELEFARSIQHAALPSVFPPYPNRRDFEIYADMFTAKEVGGDFYDFYLLDEEHLAFLIADVSGKGIPAAMFMMTAKTMIKSMVESGVPLAEAFAKANDKLCENNEAGMFVTVWMGVLNTTTHLVTFVNAGHNPPLLRRADSSFEYLRTKPELILSCMDGIVYHTHETTLNPRDTLFLYTDGVTEATDANNELYGEERLLAAANANADADVKTFCARIKEDVDRFVGAAPQFDDITMLALTPARFSEEKLGKRL